MLDVISKIFKKLFKNEILLYVAVGRTRRQLSRMPGLARNEKEHPHWLSPAIAKMLCTVHRSLNGLFVY